MAFPSGPTNGQVATVGGITYIYNSTKGAWVRITSSGTNLTANSLTIGSGATSTTTTTGAVIVTGGIGVGGTVVAGQLNSTGNVLAAGGVYNALLVNGNLTLTGSLIGNIDLSTNASDSSYKKIVRVATTGANVNLVGGAPNTLDGITLAANDRILVKDQTPAGLNGIYSVATLGTGVNGTWSRTVDADSTTDIDGATVGIGEGTVNGGRRYQTYWKATNVLGVSSMYWNRLVDVNASSNIALQTTAIGLDFATPSDLVTMGVGSLADLAVNSFGARALQATGASTYTRAHTLYIAGAPTAGTNTTITSPFAMYAASGNIGAPSSWISAGTVNVTGNVLGAAATFNTIVSSTIPAATADDTTVPNTAWVRDQGGFQNIVTYTNTTFAFANTSATFPAWATKVKVTTVGGGGAGGGNPATVGVVGAGGGGGGICVSYFAVVPGSQYWANVGAGGVSVIAAAGGAGNISTFTISGILFHQASGGRGGELGVATTNVVGGAGGTALGGNLNLPGSSGGVSNYHSATAGQSSSGVGASGYEGMGAAVAVRATAAGSLAGVIGGNIGAGGSGSAGGAATATTNLGGRGGGGIIIVEY